MKAWKVIPNETKLDLQSQDVSLRDPAEGEVRVRIHATSLNKRDLMVANGTYPGVKEGGLVPLSDGAGEVVALGEGVDSLELGDRVANLFWRDWIEGHLAADSIAMGASVDGVLSEEIVLPAHALIKIPDFLSFEEAATLPCAALTAWNALMETGNLKPGQTVLTLGTGGVSLFALQFAKAAGATVIITSSRDEKLARAKAMGADMVINYRITPDWAAEVQRLTDGKGADVVIETGGPGTLNQSLEAAAFGGQVTMIGVQAGVSENISPLPILFKKLRLQGIMVGNKKMFENMLAQIIRHKIRPIVDQVFSFEDTAKAFKTMEAANHFGKIAILS
ncbi:NAD(P)-dependent alcohol dehydrogenase [Motiliproteus sp. MSK22-1]|uniref:zinc-dependent alcohol dehydrogenase family protein n=1 Tax=Motiliproteus sp. MSK22-1 TaxID=1897630 RepID=UPI0009761026|nr:NAD(P)-dependent alcohol dehydrogenase [Motiliproteus sp. MSK22-1]OMH25543.1 alcohol dehydrogenase [Motiliproteus sp. MSK22-1]